MEAFSRQAPHWTKTATHAMSFQCPYCSARPRQAKRVWVNRHAPVIMEDYQKKWQEFYLCECDEVWWCWSDQRPSPFPDWETR